MIPTYIFLFIAIIFAIVFGTAGTMIRNYVETSRKHAVK